MTKQPILEKAARSEDYIKKVINEAAKDCKIMENSTELRLSKMFRIALKNEDFKTCAKIKAEIEKRIDNNTIDIELIEELDLSGLNGLFDNYKK